VTAPRMRPPFLNVVVPCYNEEEVLPATARQLSALLDGMIAAGSVTPESGIYFVDDGSHDATWASIAQLCVNRPGFFHGIKLSRNQGHQSAVLAGLHNAPGDCLISIDADLQDDTAVIAAMVARYTEGHEIVYGVRQDRSTDTTFKRLTACGYYRLLIWLGVEMVQDHADFRLLGRSALNALTKYKETNLFLRAIVPLLGFPSCRVYYDRKPRMAGESKYPLTKMIALAINGITSFSMRPLRLITTLGLSMAAVSFVVGVWAIWIAMFSARAVPGWASTVVPLAFVGGLQLLSMGVIGEYIGKIYLEVKRRPLYEIENIL
jgi:glycosyltransferase involved in cell wall biosynthesis